MSGMMRQIIVVSLSPAIDRNYSVPSLTPGALHRCDNPVLSPGGKGVNVARVLSLMGAPVRCIGFFAGDNGQYIIRNLEQHQVTVDAILLKGETRTSLNILDPVTGRETEILEAGPTVYPDDMARFFTRFHQILSLEKSPPIVVFSGGIPKGLPSDIYEELIGTAKQYKADCFLDTSGEALVCGLKAKPFFVKPNLRELTYITKQNFKINDTVDKNLLTNIYYETRQFGVPVFAVTMGEQGAAVCVEDKVFFAHSLPVKAVNTIGSGDSFTAGMAFALANQESWKQMLKVATACASSNALFEQVGFIDPEQVKDFQNQVKIDEFIVEMR